MLRLVKFLEKFVDALLRYTELFVGVVRLLILVVRVVQPVFETFHRVRLARTRLPIREDRPMVAINDSSDELGNAESVINLILGTA